MSGFTFVTDEKGRKKAVILDLKKHGRLWQDFYDAWVCASRKNEPRESLESVKARLKSRRAHG
jgi:hypothetical protein